MSLEMLVVQSLQIAALVVFVWVLSKTIARKNAHLSFALWLVVLAKCVTPPVLSSPMSVFSWLPVESSQRELVPLDEDVRFPPELTEPLSFSSSASEIESVELATAVFNSAETTSTSQLENEFKKTPKQQIDRSSIEAKQSAVWLRLIEWLPRVWLSIAALLMIGTMIRAWAFIRVLSASSVEDASMQTRANEVSQKLGLKRRVQVLVTSTSVGPAVIGLFRPRIVIPDRLTKNFSRSDLDPILAHELLHIRRGDLWIGLFRHSVSMLWWFHPFVWKTNNAIRLGAETCCDEEVVAALGISAKKYARSLLSVLELKQELKAIPVAPGVRPFDITANRLEKFMTCEIIGRSRTPLSLIHI